MAEDVMMVVVVWMLGALWQFTVGVMLMRATKKTLVDGGWAWGRLAGWLSTGLVVWWLGYAGVAINTNVGVWLVVAVIVGVAGLSNLMKRDEVKKLLRAKWRVILIEEMLFLFGLLFMSLVRGYNPKVLDLEKFMDVGFMNSYLRSPTLPANDMWLAGEKINYYSFGHFLGSVAVRLWGIPMAYGYNLLLGWMMGLVLTGVFSVVVNISRLRAGVSKRLNVGEMLAGLVGVALVGFGGNSHVVWYWLKNKSWEGYWYADATRFIENTIHEFPSYSFVVSDLHAHLWDLPVVLMFLVAVVGWIKSRKRNRRVWSALLGALVGVMAMTNTWDVLVYGLLSLVLMGVMLASRKVKLKELLVSVLIAGTAMVIVALPWWHGFESIGQGIEVVGLRSPTRDLAILWTGHVVLSGLVLVWTLKQKRRNWLAMSLVLVAWILILIPEIVYVKDIYPNHPRANTMFKLTYQALVMMSVVIGAGVAMAKTVRVRLVVWSVMIMAVAGALSFPVFAYSGYYSELRQYVGMDGEEWMKIEDKDDWKAIKWLRNNAGDSDVVLEAVGESYTKFGRVSAFTGIPTVLGWRVHEWLWRGGFEIAGQRTEEVKAIYENPYSERAEMLMDGHGVSYIFVGSREKETYQLAGKNIEGLGEVVFVSGETKIIKL